MIRLTYFTYTKPILVRRFVNVNLDKLIPIFSILFLLTSVSQTQFLNFIHPHFEKCISWDVTELTLDDFPFLQRLTLDSFIELAATLFQYPRSRLKYVRIFNWMLRFFGPNFPIVVVSFLKQFQDLSSFVLKANNGWRIPLQNLKMFADIIQLQKDIYWKDLLSRIRLI